MRSSEAVRGVSSSFVTLILSVALSITRFNVAAR
jgi:hypothetical protein